MKQKVLQHTHNNLIGKYSLRSLMHITTGICNTIFLFLIAVLRRLEYLGTNKDYFPSDAANKTYHIRPNIRQAHSPIKHV
jgi:hypothetical protein